MLGFFFTCCKVEDKTPKLAGDDSMVKTHKTDMLVPISFTHLCPVTDKENRKTREPERNPWKKLKDASESFLSQ